MSGLLSIRASRKHEVKQSDRAPSVATIPASDASIIKGTPQFVLGTEGWRGAPLKVWQSMPRDLQSCLVVGGCMFPFTPVSDLVTVVSTRGYAGMEAFKKTGGTWPEAFKKSYMRAGIEFPFNVAKRGCPPIVKRHADESSVKKTGKTMSAMQMSAVQFGTTAAMTFCFGNPISVLSARATLDPEYNGSIFVAWAALPKGVKPRLKALTSGATLVCARDASFTGIFYPINKKLQEYPFFSEGREGPLLSGITAAVVATPVSAGFSRVAQEQRLATKTINIITAFSRVIDIDGQGSVRSALLTQARRLPCSLAFTIPVGFAYAAAAEIIDDAPRSPDEL